MMDLLKVFSVNPLEQLRRGKYFTIFSKSLSLFQPIGYDIDISYSYAFLFFIVVMIIIILCDASLIRFEQIAAATSFFVAWSCCRRHRHRLLAHLMS
ncbi:hypothetical protein ACHAXM_000436 [Skeletonema potamos]